MYEDLQKLELLIVENFFDLNADFLKLNSIIVNEASRLIGIISNPKDNVIRQEEFAQQNNKYQKDFIDSSSSLRKKLIEQYINVTQSPMNIYEIAYSFKKL